MARGGRPAAPRGVAASPAGRRGGPPGAAVIDDGLAGT